MVSMERTSDRTENGDRKETISEAVARLVGDRVSQGLPGQVEDLAALARIAEILKSDGAPQ